MQSITKKILITALLAILSFGGNGVFAAKNVCPLDIPIVGPSYGDDYTDTAPVYSGDDNSGEYSGDVATNTYESANLGRTANPGGNSYSPSFNSVHGKTLCHPSDNSGHGVYQNRDASSAGRGDAVDITPSNGKAYAAFDGTAYRIGGSSGSYSSGSRDGGIRLVSKDGRIVAYYYHIDPIIQSGQEVTAGTVIARTGVAGIRHIHFELLVDGKSVHGDSSLCGNANKYVRSLWANMKKVLGLS